MLLDVYVFTTDHTNFVFSKKCNAFAHPAFYRYQMLTADQERIIVEECKTDAARFGVLYDEYSPLIFGYIIRRVGSYEVAKDLSSETFLRAFTSIGHFVWKGISLSSRRSRILTS